MALITVYRNARARDLLDAFLVSAISSLLLVRFYLEATGYPKVGSGSLHIAHMLYGGLFMMAAIVITLTFLGVRARQISAVVGGIGFGIFIDELGKFITNDNNYFFSPTIGIIYAIFVILYLMFNFLTRTQRLSSREYQINALAELEEAIAYDMDKAEKQRIIELLNASSQRSNITKQLRNLVETLEISAAEKPSKMNLYFKKVDRIYRNFWSRRNSHALIRFLFIAQVVILSLAAVYTVYNNFDDVSSIFSGVPTYGQELLIGQVISAGIAGAFVFYGITLLGTSRLEAFEQFRRAALINIYLTEFFVFVRIQFDALPGFILNVLMLLLITFVLRQEKRIGNNHAPGK
jgi:hypothetical protein